MITSNTNSQPGKGSAMVSSGPAIFLRLEGLVLFCGGLFLYAQTDSSWLLFGLLLLAPDLAMLPYLINPHLGSLGYNLVHTYALPLILAIAAYYWQWSLPLALALIWLTHIGMDRVAGYGLKYPDNFKHTHLQEV